MCLRFEKKKENFYSRLYLSDVQRFVRVSFVCSFGEMSRTKVVVGKNHVGKARVK